MIGIMYRKILSALLIIAAATSFALLQRPPQWTFAFYLAGDNSLEKHQIEHLRQIMRGARSLKNANIVVLLDRDDSIARDSIAAAWKGTRIFEIPAGRAALSKPLRPGVLKA